MKNTTLTCCQAASLIFQECSYKAKKAPEGAFLTEVEVD
jgi:hypothetical protein